LWPEVVAVPAMNLNNILATSGAMVVDSLVPMGEQQIGVLLPAMEREALNRQVEQEDSAVEIPMGNPEPLE
jgi:hypothetical protein